ncbi:MAG: hypothetical protein ACLFVR_16030 [Thiohalospira sp.]
MKGKLSLIFLGFFLILGSVFGAPNFEYTQTDIWNDYTMVDKGNTFYDTITTRTSDGVPYEETIFGTNRTYDKSFEFPNFEQTLYVKIHPTRNDNMTIMWRGDLSSDDNNLYVQPLQVQAEPYIFKFTPSKTDDILKFYVQFDDDSQIAGVELTQQQPKGFGYTLERFMGATEDIVDINITLWKIGFYLFILLVLTAFASTVLGLGIWIFDYIRLLKEKRRRAVNEKYE